MRRVSERGVTLLEAMIALTVLVTGIAALFGLINHVHSANRTMAYATSSIDVFAQISAQIRDARCDFDADNPPGPGTVDAALTDPGLASVLGGAWVSGPIGGSQISLIGDLDGSNPALPKLVPPLRVDYRVQVEDTAKLTAQDGNAPVPNAPSLEVDVRIRELTGDPARDNPALEDAYWIRTFPVKKLCNPRLDETSRGEYL